MLSKERSGWVGKSKVGDVTETVKYKKEPPTRFAVFSPFTDQDIWKM